MHLPKEIKELRKLKDFAKVFGYMFPASKHEEIQCPEDYFCFVAVTI